MKPDFIYLPEYLDSGSTKLRGVNIAKALDCSIYPINYQIKNKKIIVLKLADYSKLIELKKNNNEIIVDMVDFPHINQLSLFKNFDYGIFTSNQQMNKFKKYFKYPEKCKVIYHHWDPRLDGIKINSNNFIKIGYIGSHKKCFMYKEINKINYHSFNGLNFDSNISVYKNYNVHYVVKPEKHENLIQPMTKISNASALGCPVICYKSPQYEELLTSKYPYYCNLINKEEILKTIAYVESTFNKKEWYTAIEIMNNIKEKTKFDQIINNYKKYFL